MYWVRAMQGLTYWMRVAQGMTYWVRAARATRARTVRGSCASLGSTNPCSASASASASPLSSPSASRAGSPRPSTDAGGLPPTQAALEPAEGGLAPLIFIHGVGLGLVSFALASKCVMKCHGGAFA